MSLFRYLFLAFEDLQQRFSLCFDLRDTAEVCFVTCYLKKKEEEMFGE